MTKLSLVILELDERAVFRALGSKGVMQLARTSAGADTAPLPPPSSNQELVRLERLLNRVEVLRHSLGLAGAAASIMASEISLDEADKRLGAFEDQTRELRGQLQKLQIRREELAGESEQIRPFCSVPLPLDRRDESAFLHFLTGTLPARSLEHLPLAKDVAIVPLGEEGGLQLIIAMTTRDRRPAFEAALHQAGFRAGKLPVVPGATTAGLMGENQRQLDQVNAELRELQARVRTFAEQLHPLSLQITASAGVERKVLEASQYFPRTEKAILVNGWIPTADVAAVEEEIRKITRGCFVMSATRAEELPAEHIPVLLRHPRWLRPFAMLVTAYGLPDYRELEPTFFVAVSYLLMFGMMFGDVGHGLIFAGGGLALLWRSRQAQWRDVGLLLLFCGLSSMFFGLLYGSYFGLPALKRLALWHDPLEGDPLGFMSIAIGIGIVLMSLGLVLNIINHLRQGQWLGALLNKFGVLGVLFFWGSLALLWKYQFFRATGLLVPAVVVFLVLPVIGWTLKEPAEVMQGRRGGHSVGRRSMAAAFGESPVEVFEGLMSYFSNTISFVRLAAYAMSHSALLLAAFIMAEQVRHIAVVGGGLGVLVAVLGNLVALVLEGIVASVQALRLEYYEFFSKFFTGNGQAFQPFTLADAWAVRDSER